MKKTLSEHVYIYSIKITLAFQAKNMVTIKYYRK